MNSKHGRKRSSKRRLAAGVKTEGLEEEVRRDLLHKKEMMALPQERAALSEEMAIQLSLSQTRPPEVLNTSRQERIENSLKKLIEFNTRVAATLGSLPPATHPPPFTFDPCKPPSTEQPPIILTYRRARAIENLLIPGRGPGGDVDAPTARIPRCPDFFLGCVKVLRPPPSIVSGEDVSLPLLEFCYAVDLKFTQAWHMTNLTLGDLSSTMSLAPTERLTLEFISSQRTILEKKVIDSVEEMNSVENTTSDKEIVNVARSSTKTENWNASGSGFLNLGWIGLNAGGGGSGSTTETSQNSLQHIHESTVKSTHTLTTLHKVEVRGLTETFVQHRMTRTITNPYHDRTLLLSVYPLIKNFSIKTALDEVRPSLVIQINGLEWDDHFIISYSEFLRNELIDPLLVQELPTAIKGATPLHFPDEFYVQMRIFRQALEYLFERSDIFFAPGHYPHPRMNYIKLTNANNQEFDLHPDIPLLSFDRDKALRERNLRLRIIVGFGPDGLNVNSSTAIQIINHASFFDRVLGLGLGKFFSVLTILHTLYTDLKNRNELDEFLVALVLTIRDQIVDNWDKLTDPGTIKTLLRIDVKLDPEDRELGLNAVFRRLSGFVAIVNSVLTYRNGDVSAWLANKEPEERVKSRSATERLLRHLYCNMNYYVQRFLLYISNKTSNQAIVDFVNQIIESTNRINGRLQQGGTFIPSEVPIFLRRLFDVDRAFIDKQQIVIPSFWPVRPENNVITVPHLRDTNKQIINIKDVQPIVGDVQVPLADGIHLEVSPGKCTLTEVPEIFDRSFSLKLKDLKISGCYDTKTPEDDNTSSPSENTGSLTGGE